MAKHAYHRYHTTAITEDPSTFAGLSTSDSMSTSIRSGAGSSGSLQDDVTPVRSKSEQNMAHLDGFATTDLPPPSTAGLVEGDDSDGSMRSVIDAVLKLGTPETSESDTFVPMARRLPETGLGRMKSRTKQSSKIARPKVAPGDVVERKSKKSNTDMDIDSESDSEFFGSNTKIQDRKNIAEFTSRKLSKETIMHMGEAKPQP
jgi:hypothetical protein